jgi:hypothetical protein
MECLYIIYYPEPVFVEYITSYASSSHSCEYQEGYEPAESRSISFCQSQSKNQKENLQLFIQSQQNPQIQLIITKATIWKTDIPTLNANANKRTWLDATGYIKCHSFHTFFRFSLNFIY